MPCFVQPALGPPRSCLIPTPTRRKAGNGSKKPLIREGKWSTARSQPDSLQREIWQGCSIHSLCWGRISNRKKERCCKDAQKVMNEEQKRPLTSQYNTSEQLKIPIQGTIKISPWNCFSCLTCITEGLKFSPVYLGQMAKVTTDITTPFVTLFTHWEVLGQALSSVETASSTRPAIQRLSLL